MKLSYLWRGLPGHPIHPPLTDATIGIYTFATIAAFIDVVGITQSNGAYGWWIALVVGLIATVFTALTGFADWLTLEWGSEIWKTATTHMFAMVSATLFFALAAIFGHPSYTHGDVSAGAFVLTLIGFWPAHPRWLARRHDRLRLRHARAQPRQRASVPRSRAGPTPQEGASRGLITRRSQVQILPPLLRRVPETGLVAERGLTKRGLAGGYGPPPVKAGMRLCRAGAFELSYSKAGPKLLTFP